MKQIEQIKAAWAHFDTEALDQLEPLYSPDVHFIDPAGEIFGRDDLFAHLRHQCRELIECRFEFDPAQETVSDNQACLGWKMVLCHRKIGGGRELTTPGISLLRFDGGVVFHRDWFDLGAMVYEHLPVFGRLARAVKGKLAYPPGN